MTADGRKLGPRPATKDHLRGKRPIRIEHEVVTDNLVAQALNKARIAMELAESKWRGLAGSIEAKAGDAKTRQAEQAEDARAAYDAAVAAYDATRETAAETMMLLVFQGISGHRLDLLNRTHRPTEDDLTEAKAQGMTPAEIRSMEHSPTTFPPALIAESLVEPKLTEAEARELIWESDSFNEAERLSILMAATRASGSVARVDLGLASGVTPSAKNSSGSQTASGNPAASSSAGSGPTP